MINRIVNSWELVKESVGVLQADKELILFPVISGIAVVIVSLSFIVPTAAAGVLDALAAGRLGNLQILTWVVAFLFYFVHYFVILFANAALVGAALIRLRGGDPTVRDGFRVASERFIPLLGYALIASTVGMLLRMLSRRRSSAGRIAVALIGLAWNLATFLVVPVLVVEDVGPLDAIRRSARLLKETWGEQIAGNLSIGLIFGLIGVLLAVLVMVPSLFLTIQFEAPALIIPGIVILVVSFVLLSLLNSTLNGIYAAAVYRYAAEGEAGEMFRPELVENAFRSG